MIVICNATPNSAQWQEFRRWVEEEWETVAPFESKQGLVLLPPILALDDGALIGGLSFTHHPAPATQQSALWINTLLVAPEFRRAGVGSKLVSAAEETAALIGVNELYVYTRIPNLYRNLGWQIHKDPHAQDTILKKACRLP